MAPEADTAVRVYLDDHLAGAATGVRLARKIAQRSDGSAEQAAFARLADDVEADRIALRHVRRSLGLPRRSPKELLGIGAEYVSRLKFVVVSYRDPGAGRLLELEALGMGIQGKLAMWRALDAWCAGDDLVAVDLAELVRRAESQHRVVESYRLAVAKQSFRMRRGGAFPSEQGEKQRAPASDRFLRLEKGGIRHE